MLFQGEQKPSFGIDVTQRPQVVDCLPDDFRNTPLIAAVAADRLRRDVARNGRCCFEVLSCRGAGFDVDSQPQPRGTLAELPPLTLVHVQETALLTILHMNFQAGETMLVSGVKQVNRCDRAETQVQVMGIGMGKQRRRADALDEPPQKIST